MNSHQAKCIKRLKEWDAPLEDWICVWVEDVREDDPEAEYAVCDLCGCGKVRFVHWMEHPDYFDTVCVGRICAAALDGDEFAAEERERVLKNRWRRKKNYLKKEWKYDGSWFLVYRKEELRIFQREDGGFAARMGARTVSTRKGRPITEFLTAVHAAFDLIDPPPFRRKRLPDGGTA